ncbi:DNA-directed RNA polymerase III subunit RPC3-like isoform X1 [Hydractinia symbiolongicarpus]|uniref:DNA-directed RNA polymerase III subunit RPC3-like isoform X1 n=1 Tax=Hydractinia symbiolongicarpus TaxID=13093 RepID=UPI00254B310C|nr:DNA-directed RNA polymerase III subunit RPC3-like isoform X1 [Hydractinia symbiolongicarpus]
MSKAKGTLASYIIKEHFGEIVEKTVTYLIKNGSRSLRDIFNSVHLNREEIKKSLSILVHHELVAYTKNKNGVTEYQARLDHILRRKRYQKYVYCAKSKFGDVAELVIENLLLNGCDTLSRVSKNVAERLESDETDDSRPDEGLVVQKCKELIVGHFLLRVRNPTTVEEEDVVEQEDSEKFVFPIGVGVKRKTTSPEQSSLKRIKLTSSECSENYEDDGVYWHVNFERFDQVFVDQMIISAASERLDQSASKIVATILKMTEMERTLISQATRSVSIFDIVKKLPSVPKLDQQEVHQYLSLLSDEKTGGFVTKKDEAAGGMYAVNIHRSINMLCQSVCATVVQERFGSKACRVFRLLLEKKHLEQKQIGEIAMIPFKEVKELLYKLFEERFLQLQEISKTADYAPSRTFYLFTVDLPQVTRFLLNRCYQAIGNLMARRRFEMDENKRLLEKNEKIEGILSALSSSNEDTEQVMQELEELITPTEKQQLEKLKIVLARLEQGEIQVEKTIFVLKNFIHLN